MLVRTIVRWSYTLFLALATVVLSAVGSYVFAPSAQWPGPIEWLTDTISLFKMSWHPPAGAAVPWPLQAARITGAFFTLSALVEVWMKFFGEQMTLLRLSLWRRHVVVCGLGRKGQRLAFEFRRRGKRVVIADIAPDEDDTQLCSRRGILIKKGDASKNVTLETAGAERADTLFAVCRDDHTNLEIGMETLARFTASRRKNKLTCYVHLVNLPLRVLLRRHQLLETRPPGFDLRFFNIYENTARALFAAFPLEEAAGDLEKRVHLIIVGLTRLGEAVATQAARIGHYRDLQRVKVTIIDEQAEMRGEQFLTRHPAMEEVCELQFLSIRFTELRFIHLSFLEDLAAERPMVVLCLEQDEANVSLALTLAEHTGGKIPVLANVGDRNGLARLLSASTSELKHKGICIFGAVEEVCGWDLLREEELDILAKLIAQHFHDRHEGPDWENSSEDRRNSNRAAADHIDVKLRAIGCRRGAAKDGQPPFAFTPEEVELLARMEHRRWNADHLLNGWVQGQPRDDDRKIHDNLVPWDQLTEEARDKDREQVGDLPSLLGKIGQAIQRA